MIKVIDSHTAGEPTRIIIEGGPDLGDGPLDQRLQRFSDSFDDFRTATVREPRGSDVLVGGMLVSPRDASCDAAVIFFNNVGFLGMCGHGMIGLVETLRHLGRITNDTCRIETSVGIVAAKIGDDGSISIDNVTSYRTAKDVAIEVPGVGSVIGDVAWGGNWFYLVKQPERSIDLAEVASLQRDAVAIRAAINQSGYPKVDHVELFGEPLHEASQSRNFVLCPGLEYDRSPCGTGTSAKLACLAADGKLDPGESWIQEGILGTSFITHYRWEDESQQRITPTIKGSAHITAEANLLLNPGDPFRWGIN